MILEVLKLENVDLKECLNSIYFLENLKMIYFFIFMILFISLEDMYSVFFYFIVNLEENKIYGFVFYN